MAQLLETVTSHIMSFEDDEITVIINSLYATGNNELAEEIWDELYGDDECECEDAACYNERLLNAIGEFIRETSV